MAEPALQLQPIGAGRDREPAAGHGELQHPLLLDQDARAGTAAMLEVHQPSGGLGGQSALAGHDAADHAGLAQGLDQQVA